MLSLNRKSVCYINYTDISKPVWLSQLPIHPKTYTSFLCPRGEVWVRHMCVGFVKCCVLRRTGRDPKAAGQALPGSM